MQVSKHFTKWLNDARFIMKEEEAAIINYYVNSIKLHKVSRNEGLGNMNSNNKTLKELIAESKNEMEENKTKQQTLLDWSSLHVTILRDEKEKMQMKLFANQHYPNKKPKKLPPGQTRNKPNQELQIIRERSFEETEHRFKHIPK